MYHAPSHKPSENSVGYESETSVVIIIGIIIASYCSCPRYICLHANRHVKIAYIFTR